MEGSLDRGRLGCDEWTEPRARVIAPQATTAITARLPSASSWRAAAGKYTFSFCSPVVGWVVGISPQNLMPTLEEKQAWMRERNAEPAPLEGLAQVTAFERHFTPKEIAGLWRLDETTIRRIFQDEPGVLRFGKSGRRDGKRDYVSLRIPESVVLRVHRELTRDGRPARRKRRHPQV